jgi:EmrB/QacA subfamily drug resistance transporter
MNADNKSQKTLALLVATLSSFLTPFMSSAINIALPSIAREFSADAVFLSWLVTAFLLTATTLLIPFGRISDIYGRRKIFFLGVSVFSLASLLCAISTSDKMLLAFRVLQGIGNAMMFGTSIAILISVFPPGERGRALGINVAAVYIGLSVGPSFGGVLTHYISWRAIFASSLLPSAVTVFFTLRLKLPALEQTERKKKFDFIGSVLFSLSIFSLMLGLSQVSTLKGKTWFLLGGLGMALFFFYQARNESPLFNIRLFKDRVFAFSNLAAFINYCATSAVSFLLSIFLQDVKTLTAREAGLVLLCQPITQAVLSPLAGALSDRIQPRIVASIGMSITALGLAAFSSLNTEMSLLFIIAVLVVLGLGFALFSSPNTNAVMGAVSKEFYGVASAALATMRLAGGMVAMTLTTLFIATFLGGSRLSPENSPLFLKSAKTAFTVFALFCAIGVFPSLARGKSEKPK